MDLPRVAALDEAIFVCKHVHEGAPIGCILRDEQGDLQALCDNGDHRPGELWHLWCWASVVEITPTLATVALDTAQMALRDEVGAWPVSALPPEDQPAAA